MGRFLNADVFTSTDQGILGHNMFAYCLNNPVNCQDPAGEIAITTLILIGSAVLGALAAGYTAYAEYKAGFDTVHIIGDSICAGIGVFLTVYTAGMSLYQTYQTYCYLNAKTPVTNIGPVNTKPAPYSHLQDPDGVAPGKDFTASQKQQIIAENMQKNNGVVKSDLSGQVLIKPQKSMKGVTPSPLEWQIDHILPKSAGGTNSFANAQVLSREENRLKWYR